VVTAIFPPSMLIIIDGSGTSHLLFSDCCEKRCYSPVILLLLTVCRNRLHTNLEPLNILRYLSRIAGKSMYIS
jgi:hypothetical protein